MLLQRKSNDNKHPEDDNDSAYSVANSLAVARKD